MANYPWANTVAPETETTVKPEKATGGRQYPTDLQEIEPLLVRREVTMKMLNISYTQVRELERMGKLAKVKLSDSRNSVVHHRLSEVRALAGQGGK